VIAEDYSCRTLRECAEDLRKGQTPETPDSKASAA